ncbi:hypothetical protein, partial [Pseudomonas syringae group genomosp. 7]|uniref:hypothetical protein n=1 Tax=Pseudomonas syringae group genomosp. 7 TaxID=251699 RepID=UPI00377060D5
MGWWILGVFFGGGVVVGWGWGLFWGVWFGFVVLVGGLLVWWVCVFGVGVVLVVVGFGVLVGVFVVVVVGSGVVGWGFDLGLGWWGFLLGLVLLGFLGLVCVVVVVVSGAVLIGELTWPADDVISVIGFGAEFDVVVVEGDFFLIQHCTTDRRQLLLQL